MPHQTSKSQQLNCSLIHLASCQDKRGLLAFAEAEKEIPFPIKRVFWIYDVPQGETRGGHANWKCAEAIFPLKGSFDIYVDDGHFSRTYHLDSPCEGIVVPAGVWCLLSNFEKDTVCFVASDEEYSKDFYINDYNEYIKQVRCRS